MITLIFIQEVQSGNNRKILEKSRKDKLNSLNKNKESYNL